MLQAGGKSLLRQKTDRGDTALHMMGAVADGARRDRQRARYLDAALPALLRAGFKANVTDAKGRTVVQLLRQGLEGRYSEERLAALREADRCQDAAGLARMRRAIRRALAASDSSGDGDDGGGAAAAPSKWARTAAVATAAEGTGAGGLPAAVPTAAAAAGGRRAAQAQEAGAGAKAEGAVPPVMGFGEYRDTPVTRLPFVYPLNWMCRKRGFFEGRPETLRQLLMWKVVRPIAKAGQPLTPIAAEAARWTYVTGYEPVLKSKSLKRPTPAELQAAKEAEHEFGTR
ncbi:hypothetical protein HXX76_009755 [Chlamydomonas incerta]|uniref:Uncharacterized protein n=1 Tax=Chlamydomonas incerta TaxID=51695 RepID=A0A835SQ23_CHLIN|nr:hypothetical protein HXX76_009755 [Chlamydomonas incerta]|eukprot:KAG2431227.1 hypothetical protein HXX76_009755 [Chlamydomonas incerta]